MPAVKLIGYPQSTYCQTAALTLEEKGVGYQWVSPDDLSNAHVAHPFDRVPILQHGTETIYETLAITYYVDDTFGEPALQPVGRDHYEHLAWQSAYLAYFSPSLLDASVRPRFVWPLFGRTPDEAAIKRAIPLMAHHIDLLNNLLTGRRFMIGRTLALVDLLYIPLILWFRLTPEGSHLLQNADAINDWVNELSQRKSVRRICVQLRHATE